MHSENIDWQKWRLFFANRSDRRLPALKTSEDYSNIPGSVAQSLAIFQLGESGGGTVIEQARRSTIPGVDEHYADAMQYFVDEEHRHAEILAICVRNLRGSLIRTNWTAKLFVSARRMIGLRLKVLVLLAAEVVGICYYHLIATRLPPSRLQSMLAQIVDDERAHLYFHCDFLRTQTQVAWRRTLFLVAWRLTMIAAAVVVLIDHRRAIRDLDLPIGTVWRRWNAYSGYAERLVTQKPFDAQDILCESACRPDYELELTQVRAVP